MRILVICMNIKNQRFYFVIIEMSKEKIVVVNNGGCFEDFGMKVVMYFILKESNVN